MRRPWRVALAVGVVIVVLAGGSALWFRHWSLSPAGAAGDVIVELPAGSGVRGIAHRLAAAGAVRPAWAFELLARLSPRGRALRAGEYAIAGDARPVDVLALLASGKVLLHPVTLPEGLTVREAFDQLAASPLLSGGLPPSPPEGSLLPDTYLVPRAEPRARLVSRMASGMKDLVQTIWAQRAPDLPLAGPADALTLASIIERETAVPAEYPLVAAVFHNRLRRGMRLQTDPTVIYALAQGKGSLGRPLTRADLETVHPYNTYLVTGLPPGPIANPGRAALLAAVQPAPVDYLYFVADGRGGHAFARTLDEHQRNVRAWRRVQQNGSAAQLRPAQPAD